MKAKLPRGKLLLFTAVILVFLLLLAEYICHWEEKLTTAGRLSILAYQQIPRQMFVRQVLNDGREVFRTAGLTASYQAVPVEKSEGEIRIGVLGASTVAGMGYSPTWSFAGMLQRLCDGAGKKARVINLGQTGFGSRQLVTVASRAITTLQLDHLVLYAGNNEFLEVNARLTRGENLSGYTAKAKGLLSKSALYRTLYRVIFSVRRSPAGAGLMSQKSLPLPPGVHDVVKREFVRNLSDIAQLAEGRCRLTLCTVPVNLMFGPTGKEPFFLDPAGDEKWRALFAALAYERLGRPAEASRWFAEAMNHAPAEERPAIAMIGSLKEEREQAARAVLATIDGHRSPDLNTLDLFSIALACRVAGAWDGFLPFEAHLLRKSAGTCDGTYAKGRIELLKDRPGTARTLLSSARNLDERRIRIPSDFNDAIRALAASLSLGLVELETECWDYRHFNDYCHFNLDGNLLVARKIFSHLFRDELPDIGSPADWLAGRDSDFLVPDRWLGVDGELWKVYGQRPGMLEDTKDPSGDSTPARFWRANRQYFTWAGANPEIMKQIEGTYRAGINTAFDAEAKEAVKFLLTSEGISN